MLLESVFIALGLTKVKKIFWLHFVAIATIDFVFSAILFDSADKNLNYYMLLLLSVFTYLVIIKKATFIDLIFLMILNSYLLILNLVTIPFYIYNPELGYFIYACLLILVITMRFFGLQNIYNLLLERWGKLDTRNISIIIMCLWLIISVIFIERVIPYEYSFQIFF